MLDLIEKEYKHHFDNIVILCPTLWWNETYLERDFVWKDDYVFPVEPKGNLLEIIEKLSSLFASEETLFVVDDLVADETLEQTASTVVGARDLGSTSPPQFVSSDSIVHSYPKKFV